MTSKPTIKYFSPIAWQLICLTVSITVFTLILLNRSPNILRPLSMSLRTGFGLVIPAAAILVYIAFRIPGRLGEFLSMAGTLSLFALPLAGLWASGQTQTTVLSGIIPFYDAESYYIDALRLINGSIFSVFSARRPLFPALLAVLLSWTNHNLMASLAILTGITGLACYFAAREIQRTYGAEASTFILIVLFLFFRAHSGVTMSENLGVALGVLGFALLWQGASSRSTFYLCFGLFITTLALNARAGAFFMLPLLILWVGWLFRGANRFAWRTAFFATLAVIFGFFINLSLTRVIAVPSGVPFANFSYTLYGLASGGKSWAYIFTAHPEVLALQEPEQSARIYQLAFELIREKPLQTIQGALFSWKMLFSNTWYNIYSYVGGENWTLNVYARWGMYLLGIAGIYAWVRDRNDPIKSLIMVSFLGVLISVPFLPPTDAYRMRPYAASIIVLAALPALGLHFILKRTKLEALTKSTFVSNVFSGPLIFSSIIMGITFIGSIGLKLTSLPSTLQPVVCSREDSDSIVVHFAEGTYINIKKQGLSFLDWMPNFHTGQFRENAHSLASIELIQWAESLEPPTTLFLSLDLHTNQKVLVVFNTEAIPSPGETRQFCGTFATDQFLLPYRVFYADEALPLSP